MFSFLNNVANTVINSVGTLFVSIGVTMGGVSELPQQVSIPVTPDQDTLESVKTSSNSTSSSKSQGSPVDDSVTHEVEHPKKEKPISRQVVQEVKDKPAATSVELSTKSPKVDRCPNISGLQETTPAGYSYYVSEEKCLTESEIADIVEEQVLKDKCKNLREEALTSLKDYQDYKAETVKLVGEIEDKQISLQMIQGRQEALYNNRKQTEIDLYNEQNYKISEYNLECG